MGSDELLAVRLRLQDARKFVADATSSAAAVKAISKAADDTSRSVDRGNRSNFAYSQGLYTLRRGAFWATAGLAGLAAGALTMGFKFNASMESNQLVMSQFLGSTAAAKQELGSLFQLAATGPFEFTNLVASARQFLAFGFTLKETNADLRILSDTAAGLQIGGAGIEHLVMVFGQIRASGRLLGQDMLQLQQTGINVRGILQSQLGLSKAQMLDLAKGTLSIPSEIAIPAIMAGLNRDPSAGGFRGLSQKLQGTFNALTATAHDYASQLFGVITHPWFLDAEKSLKRLNPLLLAAGRAYKTGGFNALFQTLDSGLGANGRLMSSWLNVQAVGQDLDRIVRQALIPAFGALWVTVGLGSPPMNLLIGILGVLSRHTTAVKVALVVLTLWFAYTRTAMLAFGLAGRIAGVEMVAFTGLTAESTAGMKLFALWTYRAELGALALRRSMLLLGAIGPIALLVTLAYVVKKSGFAPSVEGHGFWRKASHLVLGSEHPIRDFENKSAIGKWLDLGTKPTERVKANAPIDIGAHVANAIKKTPMQLTGDVNLDGKKVGNAVFNAQQAAAARG